MVKTGDEPLTRAVPVSRGPIKLLFMELDSLRHDYARHGQAKPAPQPPAAAGGTGVDGQQARIEVQALCAASAEPSPTQASGGRHAVISKVAESPSAARGKGAMRRRPRSLAVPIAHAERPEDMAAGVPPINVDIVSTLLMTSRSATDFTNDDGPPAVS